MILAFTERYFEYRCKESKSSADAHLWYRSHQKVVVIECENSEYFIEGETSQTRLENGVPLCYKVCFSDGFCATAFEDELLLNESQYERPNPPH